MEKNSNFADHCQLQAHNFKTAQPIDKEIKDVSSTINVLQNGTKLTTPSTQGWDARPQNCKFYDT